MYVREYLTEQKIPFEMILHRPTITASRMARAVHVSGRRVAKSVLLRGETGFVLAVLAATHRVDLPRLRVVLGHHELRLASEAELGEVFSDCQPGAMPPLGRKYGVCTVLDRSLESSSEIVFEGNQTHEAVRIRLADYEAIESPLRADFAEEIRLTGKPATRPGVA
jgi:Ala-tRNA(Pro) deacylase